MAKTKGIKVHICTISDYLNGSESIPHVLVRAFSDSIPAAFETLCLDITKKNTIYLGRELWEKAQIKAQTIDECEIYKKIKSVCDDIEKAKTTFVSGANYWEKIVSRWKLLKYGFATIPAEELLAMHICRNGYNSKEYDKFIALLDEGIITYDEVAPLFDADRIRRIRPLEWSEPQGKFFSVDEVPYLERIVELALFKEYTNEEMIQSWNGMKKMKKQQLSCDDWKGYIDLSEALHVLFATCSYEHMQKHHVAFLILIDRF